MTGVPIALSGPPGSGKSTAGRTAAATLGFEFVSAGELFRSEAARRGLSVADLGALAENDPSIDRQLDETMMRLVHPGRVLDGRIVGALARRRGIEVRCVRVTAAEAVRVARLAEREGVDRATSERLTKAREASESRRYWKYYQIDPSAEPVDLEVDSTELPAEAVASRIVRFARSGGSVRR